MVTTIIAKKKYTDENFDKKANGKHFGSRHYTTVIKDDTDCYWINELGKKCILFKYRKNAIKMNKKQLDEIRDIYQKFGKQGTEKIKTDGFKFTMNKKQPSFVLNKEGQKLPVYTRSQRSKISGFYDRASVPDLIRNFNTTNVCRTTRFTRDHFDKWQKAVPLFEKVGAIYKKLAPKHHKLQMELFKNSPKDLQIGNTPFTTVTSNYNWRTACHKDKGDFEQGLGNLTILGDSSFKGGYLGFPQFKVAVDVKPHDVIIMDVHQWHSNTELKADDNNVRLSFVCYYRQNMQKCNKKGKFNGETYYYKSKPKKNTK